MNEMVFIWIMVRPVDEVRSLLNGTVAYDKNELISYP